MTDTPTAAPRFVRLALGSTEAFVVSDGVLALGPPTEEFLGPPVEEVASLAARHGIPAERTPLEQNALVVRVGGKTVLVDTGTGPQRPFGPTSGVLPASLAAAGFAAADIDAVVITHVHADHAWGLIDTDGKPAFPGARVFVPAADHAFQTDEANGTSDVARRMIRTHRAVLAAVAEQTRLYGDGDELVPGVRAIAAPGHTVGHSVVRIEADGAVVYALGDLFHLTAQLERPDLIYRYDNDAAAGAASRRRLFARLADEQALVVGYHCPWPGVGRIVADGGSYRFALMAG